MNLILIDAKPEPVPVASVGGLILLAFIVTVFSVALIVGFVFLLKRLRQRRGPVINERASPATGGERIQPNNPNQP
jgi:hypothetical protein